MEESGILATYRVEKQRLGIGYQLTARGAREGLLAHWRILQQPITWMQVGETISAVKCAHSLHNN